jgi:hypothetical protein
MKLLKLRLSLAALVLVLISGRTMAQQASTTPTSPRTLSYQGVISPTPFQGGGRGVVGGGVTNLAGEHLVTVTLYSDNMGTQKLWQSTMTTTLDASGVFSTLLGTPENPLPDAQTMDRPIFLGVSLDGQPEMRPLTTVTASAYALNVADNSITSNKIAAGAVTTDKLNVDYVSAIAIDGVPITSKGDTLNLVSSDGLKFYYDPTTKQLTAAPPIKPVILSGGATTGAGNTGCTSNNDGGVGTNTVVGGCANTMNSATDHDIIAGGESNTIDSTHHAFIGGGEGNLITPGWRIPGTDALDGVAYSAIAGGFGNTVTDPMTFIGGGEYNVAGEENSSVVGGYADTALSAYSVIAGGAANRIGITHIEDDLSNASFIGSGQFNTIDGALAAIVSGDSNRIVSRAYTSFIGAGYKNTIDSAAEYSFIGGGRGNLIQGPWSAIAGGDSNNIYNLGADHNVIGGGLKNVEQNPTYGTIAGGALNLLDTAAWGSTIAGGYEDTVRSALSTIAGGMQNSIYTGEWTFGAFIGGGRFNRMGNGVDAFLGGGDSNTTFGARTTLVGGRMNHINAESAFLGGGDTNVIDWASDTSALVGGYRNYIGDSKWAFLGAGDSNRINSSPHSFLGGGHRNVLESNSSYAVLGGGYKNVIDVNSNYSTLVGGDSNVVQSSFSSLDGGENNTIFSSAPLSLLGAGQNNRISSLQNGYTIHVGGNPDDTGTFQAWSSGYSVLNGGLANTIRGALDMLGGGLGNTLDTNAVLSFLGGGIGNNIKTSLATLAGGYFNRVDANGGSIGGGYENRVSGEAATIPGGLGLQAQGYAQFVAGLYNTPQGSGTFNFGHNGEDFLAIFGNGTGGDVTHRSDAVEISIDGHIIAHDRLGNVGTIAGVARSAVFGATYSDNIIDAWGDISMAGVANANFGIDPGTPIGHVPLSGVYVITLALTNPTVGAKTLTSASITVTVQDNTPSNTSSASCGYATVSQIGVGGANKFIVRTYSGTGSSCNAQDLPFFFKVSGR